MKVRILTGVLLLAMVLSLFAPFFGLYTSMSMEAEVAARFAQSLSGVDVILRDAATLPLDALSTLSLRGGLLLAAVLATLLGALAGMLRRKWAGLVSIVLGACGVVLWASWALYAQQLAGSMLFGILLSVQWYVWLCVIISAAVLVVSIVNLKEMPRIEWGEGMWRQVSVCLAVAALLMILLPFTATTLGGDVWAQQPDAGALSSGRSGLQLITAQEPLLSEAGLLDDPLGDAGMQSLVTISGNDSSVKNLLRVPTHNPLDFSLLLLGVVCLLVGLVLACMPKVDKWFATGALGLGALLLLAGGISLLMIDTASYQFGGRTAQLMVLGLAHYTVWPLMMAVVAACAAAASAMRIATSDMPYFDNPVPSRSRLRVMAMALIVVCAGLLFAPVFTVGVYTPGKVNSQRPATSRTYNAVQLITQRGDEELISPKTRKGEPVYGEEPAENGYTAGDIAANVSGGLLRVGIAAACAVVLLTVSLVLLALGRAERRAMILLELLAAALLLVAWVLSLGAIPKDMGTMSAQIPLFAAVFAAAFAAFFTGFVHHEELPKKYKLFLMILPFLGFVLVFSYLPLAGWRYAFYNYRLGLPMDQQEFVGLKWFQQLVGSPVQRAEIVRVMKNTLGMSGLGLLTSWMPVVFAILLTEIKTRWFKKFAQIFTTLPNFISWVLVYSFALSIFSLDTGIVNRMLLELGVISEPVAWLNSGNHIWLKMWLWNTWKGLGWGAIMYLAAIAGIDQALYEAARVDGAGRFRQIWHITVPGILPTFFVLLLLSISNIINNGMEQYLVFQNAMNKSTIEVLDLYVYNISIGSRSSTTISMATAIGILKSIVSIVLLFLANSFSKLVRGESIV